MEKRYVTGCLLAGLVMWPAAQVLAAPQVVNQMSVPIEVQVKATHEITASWTEGAPLTVNVQQGQAVGDLQIDTKLVSGSQPFSHTTHRVVLPLNDPKNEGITLSHEQDPSNVIVLVHQRLKPVDYAGQKSLELTSLHVQKAQLTLSAKERYENLKVGRYSANQEILLVRN
ncbi:hypothetical protein [Aeromonas allosaccharophila]|uniref:hypothetical protein n=1 Tax=Aeromonas allosaccharophila TaxID=656 RepID=UPI002AE0B142|nr:hypothetical protein [Aeromonas allosaccharophila]